jgi:hypothetical protein
VAFTAENIAELRHGVLVFSYSIMYLALPVHKLQGQYEVNQTFHLGGDSRSNARAPSLTGVKRPR